MTILPLYLRRRRRTLAAATLILVAALAFGLVQGSWVALLLAGTAALAWGLTPIMARLARRLDAVAHLGMRGLHRRTTPLAGGLAILVPVVLVALLEGIQGSGRMAGLLIAAALLAAIGLLDDVRHVRARLRLLVHGLAGLVLVLTGWTLETLSLGGSLALNLGAWGPVLLVVWVVACINAFNLVDGLDGLCSSLAVVAASGGMLAGAHPGLCAVTAGGSLGFLRHNAPAARVFLGGVGSQLLGLLVAGIALSLPTDGNLVLALALVAYPAGDVALAILRRALRAKPLFVGDVSHVHHKLIGHLGSARRTLAVIVAFAALQATVALTLGGWAALALGIGAWALAVTALLWAGHVGLPHMLRNRRSFRRLHALRAYVEQLLHLATSTDEVRGALERMVEDLRLVRLSVTTLGAVREVAPLPEHTVSLTVTWRHGEATWAYVSGTVDPALERELRTVVSDLLRLAHARLLHMKRAQRSADVDDRGQLPSASRKPLR